jgi:hypothetical protein
MKQCLYIVFTLCTLLGFIGCNEKPNNYPAAPAGSLSIADNRTIVRLNNSIDSFEVTFTSTCDWHITTTGKAFSVSPMKGAGSTEPQKITISALSENVSEKAVTRGRFDICLDGYSTKHTIKVVQCAVPDRTILAYFFGTSLSYFFDINIDCMKQAIAFDILGNDRLLVLAQTSRYKGVIKELYYDSSSKQGAENIICEIDIPSSFDGEKFGETLSKMMQIAPADNYALIVGGHSTAWLPNIPASGGTPFKVGYGYRPNWSPAIGAEITRTIGENNVKLDVEDFAAGLSATNQVFDWIYFDVCFMSSIEASYALRNNTKYVIGSPCEIMGYGSPFDQLLDDLVVDNFDAACRAYRDYYANDHYGSNSGCIATIVCDQLDNLASIVKSLNQESVSTDLNVLSLQTYEGRSAHIFYDIEDYVINAYVDSPMISTFCAQLDKTVINRYHTEKFYSTYNAQLNDIHHYSGINFTPDEACINVLDRQIKDLESSGQDSGTNYTNLQNQFRELNHYLPSLRNTEWYKATH